MGAADFLASVLATALGGAIALTGVYFQLRADRRAREEAADREIKLRQADRESAEEAGRAEAFRRLLPELVALGYASSSGVESSPQDWNRANVIASTLGLWVPREDWPIAAVVWRIAYVVGSSSTPQTFDITQAGQGWISRWLKGELTSDDVKRAWEHRYDELELPDPDQPREWYGL